MGDILGIGMTHFPGFVHDDKEMSMRVKQVTTSGRVPDELKNPANWPASMRAEWGDDEGESFAHKHRALFREGMRHIRAAIDDFKPDAVIIFGDDQYELFKEDLVPPYCTFILDEFELRPFQHHRAGVPQPNVWGEPHEKVFTYRGNANAARYLTRSALEHGFDMSYSYVLRDKNAGMGHAFTNTLIYLDYERSGWQHPVIPVAINAYGSSLIRNQGLLKHLFENNDAEADPPGPAPWRLFDLGALLARKLRESPWRTVFVGSSSWSHAFLTEKNHYVYPDVESDRVRFAALRDGDYLHWRNLSIRELEDCGEHELLNWMPMVGAMHELGQRASLCELLETWVMNSCKVNAIFPPR